MIADPLGSTEPVRLLTNHTTNQNEENTMEIKVAIKRVGVRKGTVGWLKSSMEDGSLFLEEGHQSDNGFHGLWLKGEALEPRKSIFLAGFNQFGLSTGEYDKAASYEIADEHFTPRQFSTACWSSIMKIAQIWCNECNEEIENEQPISGVKVTRVEVDA